MKKFLFYVLQILSLFLFVVLLSGVYSTFKKLIDSQEEMLFNIGYGFGAVLIFSLLFWLNIRLYKYASLNKAN
ncbi:hypothetical protein [Flavobacterium sp. 102]|uniref:hypothetical protein n=1 Tax=Flavobacterium sp. 102 TaxID=2135623 RepID=UPI000EAC34D9|nr:hypothetical protein [Flavobacterium sp. 102]RKS02269.1 hypothetical protein C8C84_1978 [Flavobacterium sp. 102]